MYNLKGIRRGIIKNSPYAAAHEESCLLAGVDEISNFDLLKDLAEVVDFMM